MESKTLENIKVFYFMTVSVMMYYFLNEQINVGLHITHRHAFALVLGFSAFILFLIKPDIARGITSFKAAVMYSVPLGVTIVASLFIWFMNTVDTGVVSRGLSSTLIFVNMFSMAFGTISFLYVFGQKGIWYNLIAILIANILMIFTIMLEYGAANYFSEFVTLIVTFASETGDIIVRAEVHELAFCLGAYLIYMLYKPQKNILYFILMALSLFCFLSALKRIAIIAMVIALGIGYILKFISRYSKKTVWWLITIMSFIVIFLLVGYIALIKANAFEVLEKAGINTSGRVEIYDAVDEFYEFSPAFLGNGIGFLTYQLNTFMNVGVASVHNDFLQHFIDLGFWGYIIWLVSMIPLRAWYFGAGGKTDSAIVAFMMVLYLVIVSSTDNTMNYPLLTGVLALLMTGNEFNKSVYDNEMKLFGSVCDKNSAKGSDFLL